LQMVRFRHMLIHRSSRIYGKRRCLRVRGAIAMTSAIPWVGGTFYRAGRILAAFPPETTYSTSVEVFGGVAHVLFRKPRSKHLEVYNDLNGDLVNFWMICRNQPHELQRQIESLPYARSLSEDWHQSLFDGTPMSEMERAVRWFSVLRSSIGGVIRTSKGNWGYEVQGTSSAQSLQNATQLFASVSERLRAVQIECQDFEKIILRYERSSTLLYCDPPSIGMQHYYLGVPPFTLADHGRLADLLNATPAQVALSYSPHEALDEWYPASRWRRITWQTDKHAEKTRTTRQTATEVLLLNYSESHMSLWHVDSSM
jgi:DNA adenine methylase